MSSLNGNTALSSDPTDPFVANPLPFGPPADYQGGLPEDLAELGFPPQRPEVQPQRVPGDGHFIIPHVATFQSIVNLTSRTYRAAFDQCLVDNRSNSYVMRYDPTIMSALRDRQIPLIQLPWHIEADDESDPEQKWMADEAQKIIQATPRFHDMRRQLAEAIWYGKYGIQLALRWDFSRGYKRVMCSDHAPVMGDKIVMTFGGRPGVLVHGAYQGPRTLTDIGVAHLLSPQEREQFILHTFEPEDADIFQGDFAGQRYGYGVRGRIYWWWWQRNVVMQWMMDFLQTIGVGGIMIYYYEENNEASLAAATQAANSQQSSTAILMPRRRNLQGGVDEVNKVDRIEASQAGADLIYKIIVDYFNQVMRDYILMERLTTRTGATGLGSMVAAAHERTAADRQRYDAEALDETITRDYLWVVQRYTWPEMPPERCPLHFKSDVDQPNPLEYMQAAQMFMALGGTVKEDKARSIIGFEKPKEGEPVLGGPQMSQPMPGEEEETAQMQEGDPDEVEKDALNPEGGFHTPWDRAEAARKGWETRRGATGKTRATPFSRRGIPVRLSRRYGSTPGKLASIADGFFGEDTSGRHLFWNAMKREVWFEVPDSDDGSKILRDAMRRIKSVPGVNRARCEPESGPSSEDGSWMEVWPETGVIVTPRRMSRATYVRERGGQPTGQQSSGVQTPIPIVDKNYKHVPDDMEGDLQLADGSVHMAKKSKRADELAIDFEYAGISKRLALQMADELPDKNMYTRADLHYGEAQEQDIRCGTCKHMVETVKTNRLGICGFFAKLKEDDPSRWNILPDVGLHEVCRAFEPEDFDEFHEANSKQAQDHVAGVVYRQLMPDYPPKAIEWVKHYPWEGPVPVPLDKIDFQNRNKWRASHEPEKVKKFVKIIGEGATKPVIIARIEGTEKYVVLDGHHRTLAFEHLGQPVIAYVVTVPHNEGPWDDMHASQRVSDSFLTKSEESEGGEVPVQESRQSNGSLRPVRHEGSQLVFEDSGEPVGEWVKSSVVPKTWTNIRLAADESAAIWLTANGEDGKRKVVYNPDLALAFARRKDVMEMVDDISNEDILQLAKSGNVEPPMTADDLLSAVATRLALAANGDTQAVAKAVSRTLGVPVIRVLSELVAPEVMC